jgi:hypothetical protein
MARAIANAHDVMIGRYRLDDHGQAEKGLPLFRAQVRDAFQLEDNAVPLGMGWGASHGSVSREEPRSAAARLPTVDAPPPQYKLKYCTSALKRAIICAISYKMAGVVNYGQMHYLIYIVF